MGTHVTKKQKIHTFGITTGIIFSYIPFYMVIKFFMMLPKLEKKHGKTLMILSYILTLVFIVVGIYMWVNLLSLSDGLQNYTYSNSYEESQDTTAQALKWIMFSSLCVMLLSILAIILRIVSAVQLNNWIKSADSDDASLEDIYDYSKLVATLFATIPLYRVIKLFMSRQELGSISPKIKNRATIFAVLISIFIAILFIGFGVGFINGFYAGFYGDVSQKGIDDRSLTIITRLVQLSVLIVGIVFGVNNNKHAKEMFKAFKDEPQQEVNDRFSYYSPQVQNINYESNNTDNDFNANTNEDDDSILF